VISHYNPHIILYVCSLQTSLSDQCDAFWSPPIPFQCCCGTQTYWLVWLNWIEVMFCHITQEMWGESSTLTVAIISHSHVQVTSPQVSHRCCGFILAWTDIILRVIPESTCTHSSVLYCQQRHTEHSLVH